MGQWLEVTKKLIEKDKNDDYTLDSVITSLRLDISAKLNNENEVALKSSTTTSPLTPKREGRTSRGRNDKKQRDEKDGEGRPYCRFCKVSGHYDSTCWQQHPEL